MVVVPPCNLLLLGSVCAHQAGPALSAAHVTLRLPLPTCATAMGSAVEEAEDSAIAIQATTILSVNRLAVLRTRLAVLRLNARSSARCLLGLPGLNVTSCAGTELSLGVAMSPCIHRTGRRSVQR